LRSWLSALLSGVVASTACSGHVETTGTGGVTSTSGTGEPLPEGGCTSDAACPTGSQCVALTPGGFRVCTSFPPEATACSMPMGSSPDQCCTSADCTMGKCYLDSNLPFFDCSGGGFSPSNTCLADACETDADCAGQVGGEPTICAPAGTVGPMRTCLVAYCHTNADCTTHGPGRCALIQNPCCTVPWGLGCVYAGGCATTVDCADAGLTFCNLDALSGSGVCAPGPAPCGG
jgi:hypothetical protein